MQRPGTILSMLSLGLATLFGCGGRYEEVDLRDERPLPAEVKLLRIRFPLGSMTVHDGPDGQLRLVGRSRKTAASAEELARLAAVDFTPQLTAQDEPGVYLYALPELPDGVDPSDAAMMLRAELYLPPAIAVDLETVRGNLSVVGRAASVRLHTGSGGIQVEDVRGKIEAFTGLGAGILHRIRGSVSFETGGGAILAYVEEIGPEGVHLKTREPSITCHLPDGAGFELDARVISSNQGKIGVRNAFEIPVSPDGTGHVARGRVGAGGPSVWLESATGWVSVTRLEREEGSPR